MPVTRGILIAAGVAALLTGCASNGSDVTSQEWVFGAPTRTAIDNAPSAQSVGDVTITTGTVQGATDETVTGTYATNQVTVFVDADSGTETRRVDVAMRVPDGELFATGVIEAVPGKPPTQRQTFAITGGTGDYAGASGTFVHEGIEGRPDFGVTLEILDRG